MARNLVTASTSATRDSKDDHDRDHSEDDHQSNDPTHAHCRHLRLEHPTGLHAQTHPSSVSEAPSEPFTNRTEALHQRRSGAAESRCAAALRPAHEVDDENDEQNDHEQPDHSITCSCDGERQRLPPSVVSDPVSQFLPREVGAKAIEWAPAEGTAVQRPCYAAAWNSEERRGTIWLGERLRGAERHPPEPPTHFASRRSPVRSRYAPLFSDVAQTSGVTSL
jgi:hypothetical protein